MKKNLLLALGLVAGMAAQAQLTESPWTGQPAPEENGTYFMYNVESGLWLQNNRKNNDYWTTYANVGSHGFDFGIIRLEDGTYQIDPKFGHNHSLNGWEAFGYMDTGQPLTKWTFTSSSAMTRHSARPIPPPGWADSRRRSMLPWKPEKTTGPW